MSVSNLQHFKFVPGKFSKATLHFQEAAHTVRELALYIMLSRGHATFKRTC